MGASRRSSAFPSSPPWKVFVAPERRKKPRRCWCWASTARSARRRCRSRHGTAPVSIGVVRKNEPYEGHANSKVDVIDASATDVAARLREITGGKGADIVFNTVGDPYFQAAHQSLAVRGRQILIAAIAPGGAVQYPGILSRPAHLCRHRHAGAVVGGDRRGAEGTWFTALPMASSSRFRSGPRAIYPLQDAKAAFLAVGGSSRDRVILRPAP